MDIKNLSTEINSCMLSDVQYLRRRLKQLKQGESNNSQSLLAQLETDIKRSLTTVETRKANLPEVSYPEELPISQKNELIKATISEKPSHHSMR